MRYAGYCFITGIILFSGSLYVLSFLVASGNVGSKKCRRRHADRRFIFYCGLDIPDVWIMDEGQFAKLGTALLLRIQLHFKADDRAVVVADDKIAINALHSFFNVIQPIAKSPDIFQIDAHAIIMYGDQ